MRVLCLENHETSDANFRHILTQAGYSVDFTDNHLEFRDSIREMHYSLVFIEHKSPTGDGFGLLRGLRRDGHNMPIVLLSAGRSSEAVVSALDSGADDYFTRPFSVEEALARIRALLRRPRDDLYLTLKAGNLEFNTSTRELEIDGDPVSLSRREANLVEAFLRRPGRIITREFLEASIFKDHQAVTPNALEASVSRLRKRLSAEGATFKIKPVRGLGYCGELAA